jgi:hypothetical protein
VADKNAAAEAEKVEANKAATDAAAKKAEADKAAAEAAKVAKVEPIIAPNPMGEAAARKLRIIAMSHSPTAPDSHVLFGAAGTRYTLGDMRDLFGLPHP